MLPFLPFTIEEQRALASEMLDKLASSDASLPDMPKLTSHENNELVDLAIQDYLPPEGARSIRRAVQALYEEKMEY